MHRRVQIRLTAAFVLAFCLASGWRGWAGVDAGQRRARREPSATAPATRVQQARTAHAMRTPVYGLQSGDARLDLRLPVSGLPTDAEMPCPRARSVARPSGRSPPYLS